MLELRYGMRNFILARSYWVSFMTLEATEFRNALGQFATGVCVITAQVPGHGAFGMTVNSFSSLSLDPPLILWSIQRDSECFPEFRQIERFAVNVLGQQHEDWSRRYASKGEHALIRGSYRQGETGVPVLVGAATTFECSLDRTYDGGDHLIIVGRVEAIADGGLKDPLVFYGGRYRKLAATEELG